MFARSQRLRKSSDISKLYKRGSRAFSEHLRLYFLHNTRGGMRVAVVASKKLDKRAVVRNRAKRRVREILKVELGRLSEPRFDILVAIQANIEEIDTAVLQQELQQLTRRLK